MRSLFRRAVLENAFPRFKTQVQPVERKRNAPPVDPPPVTIANYAQSHHRVSCRCSAHLAGMAEWRVSQIMRERNCFGKVFIEMQSTRNGARDLRNFNAVGETRANKSPSWLQTPGSCIQGGEMRQNE